MSKTISILGATGSIGRQTLDVAEQLGLRVAALTAHMDAERLEAQVRKFRPRLAVLTDEAAARDLAVRLADMDTKVLGGPEALLEAAHDVSTHSAETVDALHDYVKDNAIAYGLYVDQVYAVGREGIEVFQHPWNVLVPNACTFN